MYFNIKSKQKSNDHKVTPPQNLSMCRKVVYKYLVIFKVYD